MTQTTHRVSRWVYLLSILAVVALVVSLALHMRAYQVGQIEAQRINIVNSQQLLAERMLSAAGDVQRHAELSDLVTQFEQLQTNSDQISGNLIYNTRSDSNSASQSAEAWARFSATLRDDASAQAAGQNQPDFAPLKELSRTLNDWVTRNSSDSAQIESTGHLLQLAEAVQDKVTIGAAGEVDTERARGAWLFFDQILNRLEVAVEDGELDAGAPATLLVELRSEYNDLDRLFNGDEGATAWLGAAARAEQQQSHAVLDLALENQLAALNFASHQQQKWFRLGMIAALLTVLCLFAVAVLLLRASRYLNTEMRHTDRKNQDSILRLLDEISALAEGDLNTRATVSEDMTGAIADSVNYAVTELRRLVAAITSSADRVTVAVEETGSSAQELAKASSVQSREIQRSATYLSAMAETMEDMSQRSMEAAQIASQSVEKAVGGRRSVDETIDGMGRIRTQISQTSGLLKRLGESSTQIGEIVSLINEVTSRSSLLALNSAIHSNSADQENQRFTNIADEVQTLAATLKEAAQEIETLVHIIQDDTQAATESMNLTSDEVQHGSELAHSAGESLQNIETISRRLSVVVEHLSEKTRKQSDVVNQLSANMGVINDVTRRSAHGMQLSAAALEDLRHMATELRDGVADFVLPPAAQRFSRKDDIVGRPLLKKRERPTSSSNRFDDTRYPHYSLTGTGTLSETTRTATLDLSPDKMTTLDA